MNRKPSFYPETYDRERGNALILHREEVRPFMELPWDIYGPILYALCCWFGGAEEKEVKMADPRDQMLLRRMIEHQKENAENYYQSKMRERENKSKAGKASAEVKRERQQTATAVDSRQHVPTKGKEKDKEKDKVPEGEGLYLSSIPETGTATPCAEGLCVTAAPGDVATIHPYADDKPIEVSHVALQEDPVGVMLDFLNPPADERAKTQNALAARMRDATRVTFDAVCWKFLKEAETATTRRKDAEAKIRAQMAKEGIEDRETLLDKYPDAKARWDKVCETADTFDPGDGAAKTLFGRLKAYKPKQEKPDRKGDGE